MCMPRTWPKANLSLEFFASPLFFTFISFLPQPYPWWLPCNQRRQQNLTTASHSVFCRRLFCSLIPYDCFPFASPKPHFWTLIINFKPMPRCNIGNSFVINSTTTTLSFPHSPPILTTRPDSTNQPWPLWWPDSWMATFKSLLCQIGSRVSQLFGKEIMYFKTTFTFDVRIQLIRDNQKFTQKGDLP